MTKQEKLAVFIQYENARRNSTTIGKNQIVIDNLIKNLIKKDGIK